MIKSVDSTISRDGCHVSESHYRILVIITDAATWSLNNMMQLYVDKTKDMVVYFSQKFHSGNRSALTLEGKELERITPVKFLEVMIYIDLL